MFEMIHKLQGEFAKSPQAQAFFTILATQNLSRYVYIVHFMFYVFRLDNWKYCDHRQFNRSDEIDVRKDAAYSLEGEATSEHKVSCFC